MIKVSGVRFKKNGKIYYFDPRDVDPKVNQNVIVETARGVEFGTVVINKEVEESELVSELKPIFRVATKEDENIQRENRNSAREALLVCQDKSIEHGLDMNVLGCEYTFDRGKLLFYFTAEGRVDFRELVRELASIFRTRIELRQIGVRDEAKMVGALGCCGRPCCCSTFLSEFSPVSIKMAKDQELSLNPVKISGVCGRLMCCLKYEQDGYECIKRRMPRVGEIVETERGVGTVIDTYTIQELLKVQFRTDDDTEIELFEISDVKRTHKMDKEFLPAKSTLKEEESSEDELKNLEKE
ncbi:stage 0 sporulation family protein [Peptoniphilus sp.]|uniref:PSP1 domain-containing protein n=1 Tax=Peptoniphilus sp. TaxID=1971214 RepID=UPI003995ECA3